MSADQLLAWADWLIRHLAVFALVDLVVLVGGILWIRRRQLR